MRFKNLNFTGRLSQLPLALGVVGALSAALVSCNFSIPTTSPPSPLQNVQTVEGAERPVIGLQHNGPIRVVYQISEDQWKEGVGKGLLYLKNIRGYYKKQGIDSAKLDIRAVFHGSASTHVLTDDAWNRVKQTDTGNPNTSLISELTKSGVHIELCDTRRKREGWSKPDIHSDVLLVDAAYARVIDLQMQGYAYIKF